MGQAWHDLAADWQEKAGRFDAPRAIKVTERVTMTEIDEATAPFVEAEIKEHQAALFRQMVAVGVIICFLLILLGLHQ
jgi:hypothetical protein